MKRAWIGLVTVAVLAAIGIVGYALIQQYAGDDTEEPEAEAPLSTATVVRTDLVERETLDGTLRFADPGTVPAQSAGTITALPEAGEIVERGEALYEIDGVSVILFYGDRPAWRPLADGSDDGADVRQLEENLTVLGFDEDGDLTVDEEFTAVTADAVEAWQESLGVEADGVVPLGRVWYADGPVRIGAAAVSVGATVGPGVPVVSTSSTDREVLVLLDADRQDLMAEGDAVDVELADGTPTGGVVAEVGRIVIAAGSGPDAPRVVEVLVTLDDPTVAGEVDESPVDVDVVSDAATGVLAVPVNALLALAEGGYALEVRTDGSTRLVGVEIGSFADGLVEVSGDVAEGDVVVVPG